MKAYRWLLIGSLAAAAAFCCVISGMRLLGGRETSALTARPVTVVVDAGHGGEDGGAISCTGVPESQINLEIACRVDSFLAFCGFQTVMVRETDTAIYDASAVTISEKKSSDLRNRAKLVNGTPDALLLSIHQNLFSDGRYSGAQVFYAATDGSMELAEKVQQLLISSVDPKNRRQVKPADSVYLLNNIRCPGILVECGFLSNAEEERRLQDAAYQKKLTLAIGCALAEWTAEESDSNEV